MYDVTTQLKIQQRNKNPPKQSEVDLDSVQRVTGDVDDDEVILSHICSRGITLQATNFILQSRDRRYDKAKEVVRSRFPRQEAKGMKPA